MEINGMNIQIHKSWYNKSHVKEDGITHIIDTEHQYSVYQFGMAKNYFDIDSKTVVVDSIISDLKGVIARLEQMKQQEQEKDNEQAERD